MRKEIYERLHPQTRHGAAPGKAGGGKKAPKDAKSASFADDTAAKTGRSKRSVAQDATRADRIPEIAKVASTSLDQGEELDALARLPVAEQSALIARAWAGEKVSAKEREAATLRAVRTTRDAQQRCLWCCIYRPQRGKIRK